MRALAANIEEVFREAAARWTLLAYFFLSTIFIAIFATAVNLDVVDGALAGLKLFGNEVQLGGEQPDIQELVLGFESVFSGVLFVVSLFLAVFATAHLVPRLQDKGTIDLYLSRPVGRVSLLLSRYVAGLLLAAANIAYLILAIWLIVTWKTHVVHPRFLLGGAVILFAIAALLAFAFLIGVLTSSTAVSIMVSYGLFFISLVLAAHDRIEAAVESQWSAWLVHGLYLAMPKMIDLLKAVVTFVSDGTGPGEAIVVTPWPFVTTAIFGLVSLSLACWFFRRKEF
jgi:ABC-type transport system involved in multi-copper enzyme maturation permease subunit